MQTFPMILASVAISALAQIALKYGMSSLAVQRSMKTGLPVEIVTNIASSPMVLLGMGLYFASMVIWLFVLSKVEVSYAYPFVALGFVFTALLGRLLFHDEFSIYKVIGTLLIVGGVVVMARH